MKAGSRKWPEDGIFRLPPVFILHPSSFILHPSSFSAVFSRLPLPLKILLWFFVNLGGLVAVCALLFDAEYHFNVDWLFARGAHQRVDALRALLVDDLNTQPPDAWADVVERFADAYRVRVALYDEAGRHLLGFADELPAEVRRQLRLWPRAPSHRPDHQALVRTGAPTRYWLLFNASVDNPQAGGALELDVIAESSGAGMGGLIFDPRPWAWLAVGALVLSVLFWLPLLRGVTRAIAQVTDAARRIAEGRFDTRVPTSRRDELGTLATAINGMAARLDGLLRGQKRFLGDVAHELCAPLARLQLTLGIIEQRAADDPARRYARAAMEKAAQISALVDELLVFSRASLAEDGVRPADVDVREAVAAAVRNEAGGHGDRLGADVRLEVPARLAVRADPDLLARALGNLLRNAFRYGGDAGPILVRAEPAAGEGGGGGGAVAISVADGGPGVPEEELGRIFDAFYRVDASRDRDTGGVGLGLSIVKTCAEACGGTVSARNRPAGGLEVTLRLPAA